MRTTMLVLTAVVACAAAAGGWDTNCKNAWAGGESDDEPWKIQPYYLRDEYGTQIPDEARDKMDDFEDSWAYNYAAWREQGGYYHYIMLYFESSLGVKWLEAEARFAAKLESANAVGIWAWSDKGSWRTALASNGGGGDPPLVKRVNVDDYLIWMPDENRSILILLLSGVNQTSNEMWCDVCDINVIAVE